MELDMIRGVANRLRYDYATVEAIIRTYLDIIVEYGLTDDTCTCGEIEIIRTHEGFVCAKCGKLKL